MGELAPLVRRPVETKPDGAYREIGIRSFGKGIFHKAPTTGLEIGDKRVFAIEPGDLLFNIVFAWEGAVAVASDAERGMIGSHRFLTCVVDKTRVDARFLNYWFCRSEGREQLLWASPGGAGRNRTLGIEKLAAILVPVPPLDEQRHIVTRIEELARKVEEATTARRQAIEALSALRRSQTTALLEPLNADGRLADVMTASPRNGWSPNRDNLESGTPVLTLSSVTGWHFNSSAFKRTSEPTNAAAHYWAVQGDLLMTRSNTPELVGHAAIHSGSPTPCIYPDLIMKLSIDQSRAATRFIWYWLQTSRVRDHVRRSAKGTSPTMKKISQGIVEDIPFPAHLSLHDQGRLVCELDALQAKVDAVKDLQAETAAALNAMFPAILDQAFKGEL
jgi:type I restriction enzyme S subunit